MKSVLGRYRYCLFRARPRGSRLATQLKQLGREQKRQADAVGMVELLSVGQSLFHGQARLSRVTKHPVGERGQVSADDPGILVVRRDACAVLVGVV